MGFVVGLAIFLVGAYMRFSMTSTSDGVDVHTVGIVLMIFGALGAVDRLLRQVGRRDRARNQRERLRIDSRRTDDGRI